MTDGYRKSSFFWRNYGLSGPSQKEREGKVIEMIGLQDLQDRITRTLAVGWKQRLDWAVPFSMSLPSYFG